MRKLYTFLMAAAVAISASATTRQKAALPSMRIKATAVEQTSSVLNLPTVQTAVAPVALSSVADIEGEYQWQYYGLLQNDSGAATGIVNITVVNAATGEVTIQGLFSAGTGITGVVKGMVDVAAGTLTIANKQNLGPDSYGDTNYFYLKDLDSEGELVDGASAAASVTGTIEGTTITFPADCVFAIGDFDDEELGWWKLTCENVFTQDIDDPEDLPNLDDWTEFTTADMIDGWVIPGLKYGDGSYAEGIEFPLEVKVARNNSNSNLLLIENPYMEASGFPLSGGQNGYIILDVTDPEFVLAVPGVFSGYLNGANRIYCFNVEGFYVEAGYSKDVILGSITDLVSSTMTEEGDNTVINIPNCRFNWPGQEDKYYTWTDRADAMKAKFTIKGKVGIESVIVSEDENAPVEYFNIQGMRVDEPQPGTVVIRRQGSKVSKMIVK